MRNKTLGDVQLQENDQRLINQFVPKCFVPLIPQQFADDLLHILIAKTQVIRLSHFYLWKVPENKSLPVFTYSCKTSRLSAVCNKSIKQEQLK